VKTRHYLLAASAAAFLFVPTAMAKDTDPPAHENRMATCSHDAKEKGLKGEERQEYMSKCLKGAGHAEADKDHDAKPSHLADQQNRMKTCNAEAGKKDLHGDERRAFMSKCLKG
jgi:hypothetical protein